MPKLYPILQQFEPNIFLFSIVSSAIEHKTYLKLLKENGKPFSGHCQHLQRSNSSQAAVGQGISRRDRGIHWQVGPTAQHGASPLRPTHGRTRRPVHRSQQGRTSWDATWPSRRWFPFLPSDLLRLALPLRNCGALPWQRKKEREAVALTRRSRFFFEPRMFCEVRILQSNANFKFILWPSDHISGQSGPRCNARWPLIFVQRRFDGPDLNYKFELTQVQCCK